MVHNVGYGYPVYLQIFVMFYGKAICDFINLSFRHDKELRNRYLIRNRHKSWDLLEDGGLGMVIVVYCQGICFGMYALLKPNAPFVHSSFLTEIGWSIWAQIPFKIYESYMLINCWHVILSPWLPMNAGGYSLLRWVDELAPTKRNMPGTINQKTLDNLREDRNSYLIFKHLEILTNRLNAIITIWICGVTFYMGKLIRIYMGYATIKLAISGTLPLREYVVYPTSCAFLFILLQITFPEGEKFHTAIVCYTRKMKYHANRILRKRCRAFRPMGLWMMEFFCVQRGACVQVLFDVFDEIADVVISF
ncbi:unnamed protein product [Orchesella dallaii]|uniref:Gustatory receptor n=1 Tax=Orchesella dallaii TaxID=48710 RepID=A0ABP1S7Y0_9HEXA